MDDDIDFKVTVLFKKMTLVELKSYLANEKNKLRDDINFSRGFREYIKRIRQNAMKSLFLNHE